MEIDNSIETLIFLSILVIVLSYIISHFFLLYAYIGYRFCIEKLKHQPDIFLDKKLSKKNVKKLIIAYNISILIATLLHAFMGAIVAFITVCISIAIYIDYGVTYPKSGF